MAAYPFGPFPTFAAFKKRLLEEFGCEMLKADLPLYDMQGGTHDVYYFKRAHNTKTYAAVVPPNLKDSDILVYSVIRSICGQLRIPAASFGLDLD